MWTFADFGRCTTDRTEAAVTVPPEDFNGLRIHAPWQSSVPAPGGASGVKMINRYHKKIKSYQFMSGKAYICVVILPN